MTIQVDKLPKEPIIIAAFINPVDYQTQVPAMFARILELRDAIVDSPRYYVIIDMSHLKPGFGDIVFSLGEARKASMLRRPDIVISLHLVGSGDLFEMVAGALSQMQYGGYGAPLHKSIEEALAAVRAEISARAASTS